MPSQLQSLADADLARQSQQGSLVAFEELVWRYEGRLFRFAMHCCGNETDAREITQETFVKAFQALAQYNPGQSFAAWLFTIARHRGIDRHRAAGPVANEPVPELPDPDDPAELLARKDDRRRLWDLARRCLPAAQFQALWLRYAEDLDVGEIARVLGKTRTSIKVTLFRARQALLREEQIYEIVADQDPNLVPAGRRQDRAAEAATASGPVRTAPAVYAGRRAA